MTTIHDFQEQLSLSLSKRNEAIWESIYRQTFPTFVSMIAYEEKGEHQHSGIDRIVELAHGKRLAFDEKWRTTRFNDILLEYISNDRTQAPGWAVKPLLVDYIAYAIGPLGLCYLLPLEPLQYAWRSHGQAWIAAYGTKTAHNATYRTLNCAVPAQELYRAMGTMLRQHFPPIYAPQGNTP